MLGYLNITLASNSNNNGATTINQGGNEPLGSNNLFPIVDSEGSGAVTNSATTTFVADKNVVSSTKLFPTQIDKIVYDSSSDLTSQEIKTFLAKPVIIRQGAFTSTDTYSTISSISNPFDIIQNGMTIYRDKLNGYLGFRFTTVFKLVVNATRFQQGRYLMSYVAMGGANFGTSKHARWYSDHVATLVQRTTLPHVEIDLCCDTEATITIPYNSALNFYPLGTFGSTANDYGCVGVLKISPYVPLAAVSGDLSAPYTLYAWFEDVELISAALPQSGRAFSSSRIRGKNATETEQDSSGIGPISSALIKVRDASNILAQVPLLSSYMSAASWFSDIGANAAKVFGWSKPVVLAPSTRVTQNYLPYAANTDGPDESFPLSLSYQNSVGIANGFSGTDVDEMDFKFLSTIPVWNATIPISPSAAGTVIATLPVNPLAAIYTTVVNTATFSHFSPLQFVASHFSYWRGSLVFKIKFVKTEFHSGRISVTFSPFDAAVNIPPVIAEVTSYLHKHIIDIREANEFTFVIPYISNSPYRLATASAIGSIGNLYLHIVDPIRAPDTVTQSITMIIEKASGPDIEFAVPKIFPFSYYTGIIPQSGQVFSSVPQGTTVCANVDSTIGMSLAKGDNSLNALHNIGEKISSFRALGKLPNQLIFSVAPTLANYLNTTPFAISSGTIVLAVNTAPAVLNDFYSRLASCYVYSRGGVRIKYLDNMAVTTPNPIMVALETRSGSAPARASPISWGPSNSGGTVSVTDKLGMPVLYYRAGYSGEVQVPQYTQYHSRVNSSCVANGTDGYDTGNQSFAPQVFLSRFTNPPIATADASVLRSFSDDSNFGGFLSIPPMLGLTSTVP